MSPTYRYPMDTRNEIREFLTSRRARITPEQAGLPSYGSHRRVKGLRREEVAMLAGVSVDYYTRLERGNLSGVSEGVLDSLSRALALDEAERQHLFNLARADSTPQRSRRSAPTPALRSNVQLVLDALDMAPAYVRNGRLEVLGSNALARALFPHVFDGMAPVPNLARTQFLDARSDSFFIERDKMANDCVAILRTEAGRNPFDKGLTDLIGELCTRSDDFRQRWARHDVRQHRTGIKRFRHPLVGELELGYEVLELAGEPDLHMLVYTAAVGTPAFDSLSMLASLAATQSNIEA